MPDTTSERSERTAAASGPSSAPEGEAVAARERTAPRRPHGSRRGPADPVKALMHRHRELCERAVDPLEIAAGLEAHGVTDRTAARFRHRDVFSLADEMYARVPRGEAGSRPAPEEEPGERAATQAPPALPVLPALLPGAVALAAVAGLHFTSGAARIGAAVAGGVALACALAYSLRHGPLRAPGRTVRFGRLWVGWLLAYAMAGGGLLEQLVAGGPAIPATPGEGGPWPPAPGLLVGLALAVAPAAWSARLFSVLARRRLDGSRGLEEFAAGVRPLLLATVALHATALTGLLVLTGLVVAVEPVSAVALGILLFVARLLTVHGFARSAACGLGVAAAVEALATATVLAARLPGCAFLAGPAEAVVTAWGPGAVATVACGAAALGLLVHACAALSRASAHTA
ncbi:hypothetical protein ACFU5O_08075 [Streptomyces sp. NPDC057445]|uniref:hypothetical protein n=1 Tax=Streptomyces sp. NPDC057445 TaxID=3346136 RepID=UPI00367BFDFC